MTRYIIVTRQLLDSMRLLVPLWDALDILGFDLRSFVCDDDPWGIPADDEDGWCDAHLVFDETGVLTGVM